MEDIKIKIAVLSYFIGFIIVLFIRSYDKYDKEPLVKLFIFSVLGGFFSILVSTVLYLFIHPKFTFFDAIFKVGLVEEFSKLATLFILYQVIKKEFDEIVDGIIYVAAVSLGFSVIENILYALRDLHPYFLLYKRFVFATLGHISFSVYLGIAFYVHKKVHRNYSGLFWAFVLATLAHGLYDGVLFEKQWTSYFLIVYSGLIYFQFRLLKLAYAFSQMKQKILVDNMQLVSNDERLYCCHCNKNKADKYRFNKIDIFLCQSCNHAIVSKDNFKKILKYFRPKLNSKIYIEELQFYDGMFALNREKTIRYHAQKNRLNADITDFNDWLKNENKKDISRYLKSMEGKVFYWLGFKYLKQ